MTKQQLEAVTDALIELVTRRNDAAEDEDRGRANDAICLVIWDDGSGFLATRCDFDELENKQRFDDLDGLLKVLVDEGVEVEGET